MAPAARRFSSTAGLPLGTIVVVAIGFLLLVSLTLTTALAALRGYVLRHFEGLVGLLASMDFLLSIVLGTGLVALMYRYLPARRLAWRHVLIVLRLAFGQLAVGHGQQIMFHRQERM